MQMSAASAMTLLKEDMIDVCRVLVVDAVCIWVVVVAVGVLLLLGMYLEKSCFGVWLKDSVGDEGSAREAGPARSSEMRYGRLLVKLLSCWM